MGFGDAVEPEIREVDYPVMLDLPAPRLRAYPPETVVAEKFEAIVKLGDTNTRMKDFYDIWALKQTFAFEGSGLERAIAATFARRGTRIPVERPEAFYPDFAASPGIGDRWKSFLEGFSIDPGPLDQVTEELAEFLMPRARRAVELERHPAGDASGSDSDPTE